MPCQVLPNIKKAKHKHRKAADFSHHTIIYVPEFRRQRKNFLINNTLHGEDTGKYSDLLPARTARIRLPEETLQWLTHVMYALRQNTATALLRIRTWFLVRLGSFWLKALLLHLYPDSYSFFIILPSYYSVVNRDLMSFKCLCYFIFQINASFLNI